jgi:hypothetical protein
VGLDRRTLTHGGTVADLDGDGWRDLFISRHSRPAMLMLNDGGTFRTPEGAAFPEADRHACQAADVEDDGDVDVFCGLGAHRGAGYKVNELWLRQDDGTYVPGGAAGGAADVLGRARLATFFDLDHDRWPDLFVANKTPRTDGLPGPSVVYRRPDGVRYVRATTSGFDPTMGGDCLHAADLDRDGWEDILLCRKNLNGSGGHGIAWLRNERGVLVDRTSRLGLPKRLTMDALPVNLDGEGWLDIAEITASRLIIHRWTADGYVAVSSASLTLGTSLAAGDADGDGTPDLFVVQGGEGQNPRDRLFLVRDDGAALERFPLPGTRDGRGDVALAIDHDRNGLMDFVVLNGTKTKGPIELFAFFRD